MINTKHHHLAALPVNINPEDRVKFALVYQAGIANVYRVKCFNLKPFGRDAELLFQGDFAAAENMAHGAGLAGAVVHTFACNMAGDIRNADWTDDLESQPFSENFYPVWFTIGV